MPNDFNAGLSLGKGEVDSSILSGSTRNPSKSWLDAATDFYHSAVPSRTAREPNTSTRGKSVDFVHGSIMEIPMPDTTTTADKFEAGLDLLIALCMDAGMHPAEMAEVLKRKANDLEQAGA